MFCSKCGTEQPDDSQFCRKCGKGLTLSAISSGAAAAVAPARITAKPKVRTPFKVAAFLLILFLLAIIYVVGCSNKHGSLVDQIAKRQHTEVFNKDLTVPALRFYSVKFNVPTGATSVHVQGSFEARGGAGNDIGVYRLPQDDFVNWQNQHASRSFFNSGKITVGNFSVDCPLTPGRTISYLTIDFLS